MGKSRYYYNPQACRYERIRWTFKKIIGYVAGIMALSALILAGIIIIFDQLTETRLEKELSTQNEALSKHEQVLSGELHEIEVILASLKEKDRNVHNRLFEEGTIPEPHEHGNDILLADAGYFNTFLNTVLTASKALLRQSRSTNSAFERQIDSQKNDTINFEFVPTLSPIADPDFELLISGFGNRINPFHKGNYFHSGIDFSAPRETPVVATAPGTVTVAKRSDLKAGYGNYIEINHGNGYRTRYAHLDALDVRPYQQVSKGSVIGTVGNSGGSIAPHIHYEIIHNDKNVDPVNYLVEGLSSERYNLLFTISKNPNQSLD